MDKYYKNLIKLLFLVIFFIININDSYALTPEEIVRNQQQIILQQQEQQRQQRINQQQIEEVERLRKTREEVINNEDKLHSIDDLFSDETDVSKCKRNFKAIKLSGNKLFSTEKLNKKVLNKYIDKCMSKQNIQLLQNDLMKFYVKKGYTNARVYFDFDIKKNYKELVNGIFSLVVEEGIVDDIIIMNKNDKDSKESLFERFRTKSQTFFAFPFLKGKEFNLRDYEQGLDQINRLQSNNAKMEIRANANVENNQTPSSSSNVYIVNQKSFPISFNMSADNGGSKSTGENLANISLSFDNLISINDNIYLKYTQDTDTENSKRYNKSFYGSLSFPFGYWTFSNSINYSKYLTTVKGYYTTFHTSGNTLTQMYNMDRVLFRRQLYKINIGSSLTVKDTESYVRNLKSVTGSRKSSNINLYANNVIYTKLGTIILKPSYQRGLDWFNSKRDLRHSKMLKTEPKLQYDIVKLYAYYNTRLNLPLLTKTQIKDQDGTDLMREVKRKIKDKKTGKEKEVVEQVPYKVRNKINLNYTLTFDSQYSWHTLYGTDQFSIGGEYTIRGFRESTISGDNGYYIRNDLSVGLQQLFPIALLNTKFMNYGSIIKGKNVRLSINDFLKRSQLSIFYDYGYVKDKYSDSSDKFFNSQSGYMAGTGVALNYYGKYLNWSLTYAKTLRSPQYLQTRDGIDREGHSLYWRINGRF